MARWWRSRGGRAPRTAVPSRRLVPSDAELVMSDDAWRAYGVHGAPFFVLVDGAGSRVATEGVAWGVVQTADHVRAALRGEGTPEVLRLRPTRPPDGGPEA